MFDHRNRNFNATRMSRLLARRFVEHERRLTSAFSNPIDRATDVLLRGEPSLQCRLPGKVNECDADQEGEQALARQ